MQWPKIIQAPLKIILIQIQYETVKRMKKCLQ